MKTVLLATAAALALPAAAFAQTAAPAQTAPAATGAPEQSAQATTEAAAVDANEIIVTATRRSQVLSDVPIAVSAVSAEQLKNSGGSDIRQLNQLAPSLLVSTATTDSNAAARIRGIGTVGENPGLESSVAVFIDGVYRSRTGVGLTELGEVERIEVLRGPQGTLFGRNASAGLINIITAKPKFDLGGLAEATYGNYENFRFQGGITGPLIRDKLAFRIDGVYNKRDGFLPDVVSGRDTADRDRFLVRGQLLFTPSDDWTIRLIADYSQKNEECCAAAYISPTQNLSRDAGGNVVFSANTLKPIIQNLGGVVPEATDGSRFTRLASITPGRSYDQRTRDYGFSGEITGQIGNATLTSITAYRQYKNNGAQDGDFNSLDILYRTDALRKFQTFTQELRLQGEAFDGRVDYLVGGYYGNEKLTSTDDLKYGRDAERYANCLFPLAFGGSALVNTADTSCFNRTAAAASPSATVRGLAGLQPLGPGGFNPAGGYANLAAGIGFTPVGPGGSLFNNTGIVQDVYKQKDENYAFFTHNVFAIVPDKILLTVGLRYTHDQKKLDTSFNHNNTFCVALRAAGLASLAGIPCAINGNAGPGFASSAPGATSTENRLTGTAVLSFKPADGVLAYGSYSRGYKAGGYNLDTAALTPPPGTASPNDLRFAPEIVNAYEVGLKLDFRQFKLNAALFYESFKDFQLNLFNGVNFQVANIEACQDSLGGRDTDAINGNSACPTDRLKNGVTSKGLELEAYIYPVRDIALTAGLTYASTKYARDLTGTNGTSLGTALFQLPSRQLSNAPQYVATTSFAWTPKINDRFSALFYVDARYQSDTNTGSDLDFEKIQEGFVVANARIGLYGPEKKWGIEFWGQNIFDETYQQIAADGPAQGSGTYRGVARGLQASANQLFITFPAEPRTYGVTVRTRF